MSKFKSMTNDKLFGFRISFEIWILKFDILILSGHVKNSFLTTDLHAETAVHAG
jgi:hypothetical protein